MALKKGGNRASLGAVLEPNLHEQGMGLSCLDGSQYN
jgi:hypothetical protein